MKRGQTAQDLGIRMSSAKRRIRRASVFCRHVLTGLAIVFATVASVDLALAQVEPEPVAAVEDPMFTSEDLDSLVAPIALFPDPLLSLVLAAATEPLQVVHAYRYLEARKTDAGLKPNPDWHTAIIGLLNYPEILKMMNDDLEWTEQLGLAFIYQEEDLMDAVQQFRARVYDAGHLQSDEHIRVVHEGEIIEIYPVGDEVIYVPVYDPQLIIIWGYARWPALITYHRYPAYYWSGAAFFSGLYIGFAIRYGFDWRRHHYRVRGWHNHWRDIGIDSRHGIDFGGTPFKRQTVIVNRDRRNVTRDRRQAAVLSDRRRIRERRPSRRQEGLEFRERVRRPPGGAGPAPIRRTSPRTAREFDLLRRVAPTQRTRPEETRRPRAAPEPLHDYGRGTWTARERERGATSRERATRPTRQPSYQRERGRPTARPSTRPDRPRSSFTSPTRRDRPSVSARPPSTRRAPRSSAVRKSPTGAFRGYQDGAEARQMGTRGSKSRSRSSRTR